MDDKQLEEFYKNIQRPSDPDWEELHLTEEQKKEISRSLAAKSYELGKAVGRFRVDVLKYFKIK